ncbi:MAG: hypothetical protein M1300_06430 [Epsilonproteobacteria bacterium]|nr:hypothetical protein [Campylobacterota bacterium]
MELITATECVNKLRQAGVFKGKLPYFIQLVNGGFIPHHPKPNSSKRWYRYEEAKEAIRGMEDPSRDAQREANERNRPKPKDERTPEQIIILLSEMKQITIMRPDMFDRGALDQDDAETFDCDIAGMNEANMTVIEITNDLLALLNEISGGKFRSTKAELKVVELLHGRLVSPETVSNIYGVKSLL